jgi:hypothetical protein
MTVQKYAANRRDVNLYKTKALPNGATSSSTDGIDLGHDNAGAAPLCELELVAPALATGDLGDGATMTYVLQDSADNVTFAALETGQVAAVQTGAGGAGADGVTMRLGIPSTCRRYINVKATNSAAGDASDKSMTIRLFPTGDRAGN